VLKRLLQRLLANPKKRIYVVVGEQGRKFDEPGYSTNPRDYDFDPEGCETKSPDEFQAMPWDLPPGAEWKRGATIMKAFRVAADAIDYAYCCNLDSVVLVAFDRRDGEWVRSGDQTDLDIDW